MATVTRSPILVCLDLSKVVTLQTDASDAGLRTILTQQTNGEKRVVNYANGHLNAVEKKVTQKECLA